MGNNCRPATARPPMKIVFCWSAISGYMASCWKEMARRPGVELHVIAHRPSGDTDFNDSLLAGLSHQFLEPAEEADSGLIERLVLAEKPDIVVVTGWWIAAYRNLAHASALRNAKFVMGVDSPWRHEGQFLTRFRYGHSLKQFDHFFVTGERSWQYVTRLGIPSNRISRGMYGVDVSRWSQAVSDRIAGPWPRRFLFLGRYAHEKAIDVLVEGYRRYRSQHENPWTLVCCGTGPDGHLLDSVAGIENRGFVQPYDLSDVFASSGAFVIPSRFDPWPLALVEAAAAGLPIIASDACGSAVEMVRPFFNGFVVPTNSPQDVASAMGRVHAAEKYLPAWGERSCRLASAYSADLWADRWLDVCHRLVASPDIR